MERRRQCIDQARILSYGGIGIQLAILLLLLGVSGRAQPLSLAFDRQNNFTYATRLTLQHSWQTGPYELDIDLEHRNLLNTNLKQNPFVQAYLTARIWQFWRFSTTLSLASWLESDQFWTGQNLRYNAYTGIRLQPIRNLTIIPLLGYSWDFRRGIWDEGWSPALRLVYRRKWADELQMETRLWSRVRFIDPRRQHNISLRSDWLSQVSPEASLGFGVELGSNQIDDYKSQSIERIQSDTLAGYVSIQYQFSPNLQWEGTAYLRQSRRLFDYRLFSETTPEFNDQLYLQSELQTRQQLSWNQKKWQGMLTHTFERLNRGYQIDNSLSIPIPLFLRLEEREQQKDFSRQANYFEFLLQRPISPRHLLAISGTNQYVQYDTPADDNYDDHDELTYGTRLRWTAAWTRRFQTTYSLWGGVRRYAFLFGERSQDNYTQRNLRLDFGYQWQINDRLSLQGDQAIYVTYNVKDFTDRNLTDRSTRNLETRVRLQAQISKRWRLQTDLYRKEVHLAYLNWEAFSVTPLDTATIYRMEVNNFISLKKRPLNRRWRLALGYKHFTQLRFLNTSMISLSNLLTPINLRIRTHQTGITTGIRINNRKGTELDGSIWWQWQIQDFRYGEIQQFTTLAASYREDRLQQVEQAFRPFVKLRVGVWL